jgi:hypothetical protein
MLVANDCHPLWCAVQEQEERKGLGERVAEEIASLDQTVSTKARDATHDATEAAKGALSAVRACGLLSAGACGMAVGSCGRQPLALPVSHIGTCHRMLPRANHTSAAQAQLPLPPVLTHHRRRTRRRRPTRASETPFR